MPETPHNISQAQYMTDNTNGETSRGTESANIDTPRRRFLTVLGGVSTVALAGCSGEEPEEEDPETTDEDPEEDPEPDEEPLIQTFELDGITTGWMGSQPARIADTANPTLEMVAGETYEVIWSSAIEGTAHNFSIENEDGEVVHATEWQDFGEYTTTFTAEEDFNSYFCQPHPLSMRGPIEIVDETDGNVLTVNVEGEDGDPLAAEVSTGDQDGFSGGGFVRFGRLDEGTHEIEAWTYGHQTVTEEVSVEGDSEETTITVPPVDTSSVDRTYELSLRDGQIRGEAPSGIAGETNPDLETSAGEVVEITWTDEDGVETSPPEDITPPLSEARRSEGWVVGHNLAVQRPSGSSILRSEMLFDEGDSQTVRFVAEPEMGDYMIENIVDAQGNVEVV